MILPPIPRRSGADRQRQLALLGALQDAEDVHDRGRRRSVAGVTQALLDADKARWTGIGEGLAALARIICEACASSAFCGTRPKVDQVVRRLCEAVDDQFDAEAWGVLDAAARMAAGE
jgi:hypothetical protein